MSLLVVGSIAYDDVRTPEGEVRGALGGSAVYFSMAASLFGPVRLVGVVGEDFAWSNVELLGARSVDTAGLEVVPGGKTFRWSGEYSQDMNQRETLSVELNVFEDFQPKVPRNFRDSRFVFLANGSPVTQLSVLEQVDRPEFVVADTMDLWIQTQHKDLMELLHRVDALVLNDSEAELLTERRNLIRAGLAILDLGPSRVVIKKGEHGTLVFSRDQIVPLPAYPTVDLRDPTGAGDSFAGALMGYLARTGSTDEATFRTAVAYGTVAASFTVEGFGTQTLASVSEAQIEERFETYRAFLAL